VELYKGARSLQATLRTAQWLVWGSTIVGGLLLFAVLQGIIRRAANQLHAQHVRLLEAETMAVVGEMGSTVAHGIRNPLASIRSSAELALDADDCNWREQASAIVDAADRIEASIRDLLSFTQPTRRNGNVVHVNGVAAESVEGLRRELEHKRIDARLELDPADPQVVADPGMLRHLIVSLVVNGLEATTDGGRITVRTALCGGGRDVRVTIADSGSGIAPAQLEHVLRPFHTTKAKGLGLGLPLAKRGIERLGGRFAISSVLGEGTAVEITLPVAS